MKKTTGLMLLGAVLIIIVAGGSLSQEADEKTMRREHDPIQVPGEMLDKLLGANVKTLRLYAMNNGSMAQIPFQIDERLPSGEFIMDVGEDANPDDHNWKLDPQDFLVFRICDTGARAPREAWPSKDGLEIELEDPLDQGRSYCYLLRFEGEAPELMDIRTFDMDLHLKKNPKGGVQVEGLTYRIESLVNKIGDKRYKTSIVKTMAMPPSAGGTGINIIDGQRLRFTVELLFGQVRVNASEKDMIGGIVARREGPVRGYDLSWTSIALPMGLEGPRIYADIFLYDRMFVTPMTLSIPFNPDSIITRLLLDIGFDLNKNAVGMRYYSPNCQDGVTIDGKMTDKEKTIPDDWVPWFVLTGPQASFIFRMEPDEELRKQVVIKQQYIDDRNQAFPPEDEPGSIGYGRTRFEIKSLKKGDYNIPLVWYYPANLYKPGGYDKQMLQDYLNILDAPVIIKVGGKTARNQAMSPPPLRPKKR
jgi:hypothetical protein